ncbi:hypothetical protein B0T24DRAFT_522943 [Lasiosphaeria ovina]|uniref:NmrA-like domain-containing protein n=1 Tax=Lasiosphaeria ovina TaxID=92902 RepID=A0AAE0NDF6_9PEZI|nr:hypothetical protein B0T24DRAFT_522943 [Lasiosphaeria ovina]
MSATHTVFVSAATGSQGSNLARQLRSIGWNVHATVRNPDTPAAKTLTEQGVELTVGDWDDEAALQASIAGCDMLFLNLSPSFQNLGSERVQAARILAIAKAAGVRHVVYSSGPAAKHIEKLPIWNAKSLVGLTLLSKQAIEETLKAAGFEAWTILRGSTFMQNFLAPKVAMYAGLVDTNTWTMALLAGEKMPLVDANDIAKFAVAAFQDPERFKGKDVVVVGDELTPEEIMECLSEVTGRKLKFVALTDAEIEAQKAVNPLITAQLALRELKNFMKAEESRSWGIPMTTFKDFLAHNKDLVKQTYP